MVGALVEQIYRFNQGACIGLGMVAGSMRPGMLCGQSHFPKLLWWGTG
jgi:hypothetical protein